MGNAGGMYHTFTDAYQNHSVVKDFTGIINGPVVRGKHFYIASAALIAYGKKSAVFRAFYHNKTAVFFVLFYKDTL